MDPSLAAIAGVPWQHWAILAAVSWPFSLICLIGFYRSRRPTAARPTSDVPATAARPGGLRIEQDPLYHPRRRAA